MHPAVGSPAGFLAPGDDLDGLSDHDLLAAVVADQWLMNRLEASRQAKVAEFEARRSRDYQARRAEEPHFTMTPLRETAVEVAPLIGAAEARVKADLRTTRTLQASFPGVWALVEAGQLDLHRASLLADAAATHLREDPAAVTELAAKMTAWFADHIAAKTAGQGGDAHLGAVAGTLVTKTARQIGNRVNYLVKQLKPRDAEERFARRYRDRSARVDSTGDAMAQLVLSHDVASLQAVDYRLTMIAKAMRRQRGEERTLEQLRTDLAVDLLLGRLTVGATTGEFEHPESSPTGDPLDTVRPCPVQPWARPVINVTVPIQTLMGLTDDPGLLTGGESLPAGLVRAIAADPDSTWYRMLTDPARQCVELSVKGYKPTGPIIRQTVADYGTCFDPVCGVPATGCELDHRVPAPTGPTSTDNMGPGCKGHHRAKHAPGFGLSRTPAGQLVFTTAAGFSHRVEKAEQPVGESWGPAELWDGRYSLAELRDALAYLAHQQDQIAATAAWIREVDQAWADYRASYPGATDEEIVGWIHDDDPAAPEPPPVLRRGTTLARVLRAEATDPSGRWGVDDETLADLDDHDYLQRLHDTA